MPNGVLVPSIVTPSAMSTACPANSMPSMNIAIRSRSPRYTARMQTAKTGDDLHWLMQEGTDASLVYLTVDEAAALPEPPAGWRAADAGTTPPPATTSAAHASSCGCSAVGTSGGAAGAASALIFVAGALERRRPARKPWRGQ